eukprot:scaffold3267_cov142-Amphora_coffeaeformis.AAC.2
MSSFLYNLRNLQWIGTPYTHNKICCAHANNLDPGDGEPFVHRSFFFFDDSCLVNGSPPGIHQKQQHGIVDTGK